MLQEEKRRAEERMRAQALAKLQAEQQRKGKKNHEAKGMSAVFVAIHFFLTFLPQKRTSLRKRRKRANITKIVT